MITALKRKTTLYVFDGKGIVSFNFSALTVSIGYELLWCSYSFYFIISITTALLCSWWQVYELGIMGSFLFPVNMGLFTKYGSVFFQSSKIMLLLLLLINCCLFFCEVHFHPPTCYFFLQILSFSVWSRADWTLFSRCIEEVLIIRINNNFHNYGMFVIMCLPCWLHGRPWRSSPSALPILKFSCALLIFYMRLVRSVWSF